MKINYSQINPSLEINKWQIQSSITPQTKKENKDYKYKIYPIDVTIAQNLILQKNKLDKSLCRLSRDIILNEFSYLNDNRHELGKQ